MSSITIASIAFACISGGALLGSYIRSYLPDHHLKDSALEIVKMGAGLIATLAALVLGLLVSSAKGTLDAMNAELTQEGAKIIMLDRVLASYGPETNEVRGQMRSAVVSAIDMIWPKDKKRQASMKTIETTSSIERIQDRLRGLSPHSDTQRQLKAQALQIAADLAQTRWILIVQTEQALPPVFFVVLLFWLTVLFGCVGLLARGNATIIAVLLVCALSVSGAIFLIFEMSTPLTGIIKVSSAPLLKALGNLGR